MRLNINWNRRGFLGAWGQRSELCWRHKSFSSADKVEVTRLWPVGKSIRRAWRHYRHQLRRHDDHAGRIHPSSGAGSGDGPGGTHFVRIADLEVAAGKRIAEMLKLPRGYTALVTSGAAAAMQSGLAGILDRRQ